MHAALERVLDFVRDNAAWAPYIAFAFALAETVAFISILIPSTAILVGVGGLVATGALQMFPLWLGASLGALTGSTLSWWLGRRYGPAILSAGPLRSQQPTVERGKGLFARFGPAAVLIGHFFGPLRAVAFVLAGAAAMAFLRFQLANVPGSLAWAYVIPKSGEIGGDVIGHIWRSLTGG
ncbi:DedA family protein [Amaricoccus sp.]|uniref:DedA family protein n=1 Tax=Amaricoccus sp. TaxID=1872485 RepID=UPI001B49B713|nr:DedA family protein [Amaricoccus sp.]MBP7001271.1 DedA family protein [Amaricoccus sp.]